MADHIYLSSQVLLVGIYHGRLLTLSLLGWVPLKPEYAGGGSFTPPSKSHVWCPNMTNDKYHHWKEYITLLLESETNLQFFLANCKHVCKTKISKKKLNIHFWKALDNVISNMHTNLPKFK